MRWEAWAVLLTIAAAAVVLWWAFKAHTRRRLLRSLGDIAANRMATREAPGTEHQEVLDVIADFGHVARRGSPKRRLVALREGMDSFGGDIARDPEALGVRIEEIDVDGVPGEWVIAPHSDPNRRLLYLHGGAFFVGSRMSHRPLTAELAKRTGTSVLVVDYRLLPEHKRIDGIVDCQNSYRWILEHGPGVDGAPAEVFVAGDSAGANLALMLTWWIRDKGLRQVDGAVVFSPPTDSTFQSPSMHTNAPSDPMLGPDLGLLMKLPGWLLLPLTLIAARMRPSNPLISPLHANLSGLPPTLIQASESEMLFDDARRYARKAVNAGSPVVLQTWPGMVHVWQFSHTVLPEAREALGHVAAFINDQRPAESRATTAS